MTRRSYKPWLLEDDKRLRAFYDEGWSLLKIAAELGRKKNDIARRITLLGLSRERQPFSRAIYGRSRTSYESYVGDVDDFLTGA
jgi:hypothetical protein